MWSTIGPCSEALGRIPRSRLSMRLVVAFPAHFLGEFDVRRNGRVSAFVEIKTKSTRSGEHRTENAEHEKNGAVGGLGRARVRIAHADTAGACRPVQNGRGDDADAGAFGPSYVHRMSLRVLRRNHTP